MSPDPEELLANLRPAALRPPAMPELLLQACRPPPPSAALRETICSIQRRADTPSWRLECVLAVAMLLLMGSAWGLHKQLFSQSNTQESRQRFICHR